LKILEKVLTCRIKNSKHIQVESQDREYSGIGLENIKKSLELLYGGHYTLNISDREDEFEVNLTIPI